MSSEKRRDSKNRVLKQGVSQKPDGKYTFKYRDASGKYRHVESWRLVETDQLPIGKRQCEALRTLEKQIQRDLNDGININLSERTVLEQIDNYLSIKTFKKRSTRYTYLTQRNVTAEHDFSRKQICKVTVSDCESFIKQLVEQEHLKYNYVKALKQLLRGSFELAVKDDAIRKNPFNFSIRSLADNDGEKKAALTETELIHLLDFIREDQVCSRYYNEIFVLFNTGMRISEFCGLTDSDIDFEKRTIKIQRQLCRIPPHTYYINSPKRKSSIRTIPVDEEVCERIQNLINNRSTQNKNYAVDNVSGFLSFTRNNTPRTKEDWLSVFRTVQHRYKRVFGCDPPNLTPHICRHTYATMLAHKGFSPKTISYILGHTTILITFDTYVDCTEDSVRNEFEQISHNQRI